MNPNHLNVTQGAERRTYRVERAGQPGPYVYTAGDSGSQATAPIPSAPIARSTVLDEIVTENWRRLFPIPPEPEGRAAMIAITPDDAQVIRAALHPRPRAA